MPPPPGRTPFAPAANPDSRPVPAAGTPIFSSIKERSAAGAAESLLSLASAGGAGPSTSGGAEASAAAPFPPTASGATAHAAPPPAAREPIPRSLPAGFFGVLGCEDEHVTVWYPASGKTVAGNAAPYRRNLDTWLRTHPGWEEKADELKSSKRRSAARRARGAAQAFASMCRYDVTESLIFHAERESANAAGPTGLAGCIPPASAGGVNVKDVHDVGCDWGTEDYVRLQEALFRLGQDVHTAGGELGNIPKGCWEKVASTVSSAKSVADVVTVARHLLLCGRQKACAANAGSSAATEAVGVPDPAGAGPSTSFSAIPTPIGSTGSPATSTMSVAGSLGSGSLASGSLPSHLDSAANFLDRSFRSPREPRITVWEPETGRTVSGNAAPCRSRLQKWLDLHPGWEAKRETELSSSRRARRSTPVATPTSVSTPTNVPTPTNLQVSQPVAVAVTSNRSSAPTPAAGAHFSRNRLDGYSPPVAGSAVTIGAKAHASQDSPVFSDALAGLLAMSGGSAAELATVSCSRPPITSSVSSGSGSSRFTGDEPMNDTDEPVPDRDMADHDDDDDEDMGHADDAMDKMAD